MALAPLPPPTTGSGALSTQTSFPELPDPLARGPRRGIQQAKRAFIGLARQALGLQPAFGAGCATPGMIARWLIPTPTIFAGTGVRRARDEVVGLGSRRGRVLARGQARTGAVHREIDRRRRLRQGHRAGSLRPA